MNKTFKVGDTWLRRDGAELVIVSTTVPGGEPVAAADPKDCSVRATIDTYQPDGRYCYTTSGTHQYDLIQKVEPLWSGSVWISPNGQNVVGYPFPGYRQIIVREVR